MIFEKLSRLAILSIAMDGNRALMMWTLFDKFKPKIYAFTYYKSLKKRRNPKKKSLDLKKLT